LDKPDHAKKPKTSLTNHVHSFKPDPDRPRRYTFPIVS
jgi:hypothetical protein